jgi:hypothetical protein
MILTKLQEALAEVDSQRAALNEVEERLREMISKLSGSVQLPHAARTSMVTTGAVAPSRERDKFDDIVDILRAEGSPLHITVIAERLSALRGSEVRRTTIEPGLNRHIAKVKARRVDKFGPSTFGLPEWKTRPNQGPLQEVA